MTQGIGAQPTQQGTLDLSLIPNLILPGYISVLGNMTIRNPLNYGALFDGSGAVNPNTGNTYDFDGCQAAINALKPSGPYLGGGTWWAPSGKAVLNKSLDCRGLSNVLFRGAARGGTVISCTAALNGSDGVLFNDIFNANNLTEPYPYTMNNLVWMDMTIDCTNQNASGVPGGATAGYNLCAVECQNVNNAMAINVEFKNAFGNAFVSSSINPTAAFATTAAWVSNCIFTNCVQGVLPQYGITGSVIQYGAMNSGYVLNSQFFNCGGPVFDWFNCRATHFNGNYVYGIGTTPFALSQAGHIAAVHSDFGLTYCEMVGNHIENAGGIFLIGHNSATTQNGNIPTPGPQGCKFERNVIIGTGSYAWANQPAVPASGGQVTGPANSPWFARITGGSGVQITVSGNVQLLTGDNNDTFAGAAGANVNITYTTAPTWQWFIAPNCLTPHFSLNAGNVTGNALVQLTKCKFIGNKSIGSPQDAFSLYDAYQCTFEGNDITNPGNCSVASAYILRDSKTAGVAGTGSINNVIRGGVITDTRATKTLQANYRDDSASSTGNVFAGVSVEQTIRGAGGDPFILNTASNLYAYDLVGPGVRTPYIGTLTVPASGVDWVNSTSYDLMLYVSGGSGMQNVGIDDVNTGLISGAFLVRKGRKFNAQYSTTAPTVAQMIAR